MLMQITTHRQQSDSSRKPKRLVEQLRFYFTFLRFRKSSFMLQLLFLLLFFCFDLPNDFYSQVLDGRHVFPDKIEIES